jgi:hypothetical protein
MCLIFWWIRQILLICIGSFFLIFGVQLLFAAYRLDDPIEFILTFFSSNFIILISAALLIGFILRILSVVRNLRKHSAS